MALTPLQRQQRKNAIQEAFNEYKSVGTTLMQMGRIEPEEYYSRVRNRGIQFGIIQPNEYPDALPGFVEPIFRITGATAGAIIGSPGGLVGMSKGAGLGGAAATAVYQQFAEFFSDDMPMKPLSQKAKEVGMAGAVDFAGTMAFGGLAKAVGLGLTKHAEGTKRGSRNILTRGDQELSELSRRTGAYRLKGKFKGLFTREKSLADDKAAMIYEAGVTPTLAMVGREGLRYALEALGKMPLLGTPARKAHERYVEQYIDRYNAWTAQTKEGAGLYGKSFIIKDGRTVVKADGTAANDAFMEELNQGTPWLLINYINNKAKDLKFGKGKTFDQQGYKTIFEEGFDKPLKKMQGIDISKSTSLINNEIQKYVSTYGTEGLPKYLKRFVDPMATTRTGIMNGNELYALTNTLRKEIAARGRGVQTEDKLFDLGSLQSIRTSLIDDAIRANPTLREPFEQAQAKYLQYEKFLEQNQQVFRTAYGVNIDLPNSLAVQQSVQAGNQILKNLTKDKVPLQRQEFIKDDPGALLKIEGQFGKQTPMTPQKLIQEYQNGGATKQEVLKQAMGENNYKAWVAMQMDDIFENQLFRTGVRETGETLGTGITGAGSFNPKALKKAFGLDTKSGAAYERTQAMLKLSGLDKTFLKPITFTLPSGKTVTETQLDLMIYALSQTPSKPNLSSFLMRSFTLKGTAGPAAILGGGAVAGGASGFLLATGPLLLFTHIMSSPYSKSLLVKSVKDPAKFGNAFDEYVGKLTGPEGIFGRAQASKEGMAARSDLQQFQQSQIRLRELARQFAVETTGQATGAFERPDRELYEVNRR